MTPQEVFDTVMREQRIPWIPEHMDDEARNVTWAQLVRENRVPPENAGLINDLQRILARGEGMPGFVAYALTHNLELPACTL